MPRLQPRRECSCRSLPLAIESFGEEPVGTGPFVGLAIGAALLVAAHVFAWGHGVLLLLVLLALDLLWLGVLALFVSEWRGQRRFGLARVRLDSSSFTLGGPLALHVGSERGMRGLSGLVAWLSCVDAVMEMRETTIGQDGQKGEENQRVCYVVWADDRRAKADDLASSKELSFSFALPSEEELGDPVGDFRERYWEVELQRFGATNIQFRVLVNPPGR